MTEPVFDVAAVHRIDDVIEVFGRTPGPAGSANLVLPGGAQLRVDYADPHVLVDWSADAVRVAGQPSLVPLFGGTVAEQILAYTGSGDTTPRRLEGTTSLRPPGRPPVAMPARRAGEFLRLADRVDDDRPLLERAVAALDVAASRFDGEWGAVFATVVAAHRAVASELVDDCTDDLVLRALSDATVRDLLASPPYRDLLPAGLLDWLDRDRDRDRDTTVARALTAPSMPSAAHSVRRMAREELFDAAVPEPVVERHGGVWSVRIPGGGHARTTTWIRVLAADHTVLAVAPGRVDGRDCTVEVLVPPTFGVDDVEIVVTDEPFPVTGTNALAGIVRAVRAGRRAVDLESAGNAGLARRSWTECAARWHALGDHERGDAAQRCADSAGLRTRDARALGPPHLVDLLAGGR